MVTRRSLLGAGLGAGLGLGTAALAGCTPGGTAKADNSPAAAASNKDIAKMGPVTITMLDFWSGDTTKWVTNTLKAFKAKYPNVTVKRTSVDWGQLVQTANLRLKDPTPPDVITVNNGWQSLGVLVKAGLVTNLDNYAKLYQWDQFPSTILRQTEFSPDGTKMGEGSLFGTPVSSSSLIGIYYNGDVLKKAGADVPTDFAGFEAACAKVRSAGLIPIGYGSEDKGPNTAILLQLQDFFGSARSINDFVYSTGTVKAADIGLTEAASKLLEYSRKNWLTPNYAGIQAADALDQFQRGKAAFQFQYTGSYAFTPAQRQTFGYLQLPQPGSGKVVGTGASTAVSMSSKCKHPDVAAALLDVLAGQQCAQFVVDNGILPLLHQVQAPGNNPEFDTEIKGQQSLDRDNGYVPYFDWSTPTMLNTLAGQVQSLLAGRATPSSLVTAVQKDYDKFQATR
ncbi:MAG: extracellular solute-binding protein [Microlunatus sp.]|nr:extracellular solute-binding protein [Microlunatus sp.]